MKSIYRFLLFVFILPLFTGCHDKIMQEQTLYEPVYLSYKELRSPVISSSPESLQKPGKIYVKNQLIFINEYLKGIHVIDNTDPTNPVPLVFIDIPGNVDMAVRNNILYADSYVDLVALDISDPHHIMETGRAKDVFPYIMPPTDGKYAVDNSNVDQTKGVILQWEAKKVVQEVKYNLNPWPPWPYPIPFYFDYEGLKNSSGGGPAVMFNSGDGGVSFGTGGSMARFTLYDKWLYALTDYDLRIIRVEDPQTMIKENSVLVRRGLETIFQHDGKLFFGSKTGMIIYDISDPLNPDYITSFSHIQSCDPVIVQGNFAFVTLRNGNGCGSTINRLDVIDISDITHPLLKRSYGLSNPYGLGISDSLLFVCDGSYGLKLLNARDPLNMTITASYSDVHAYDVIPLTTSLLLIGNDGLYQYKVEGLTQIKLLSAIPVESP